MVRKPKDRQCIVKHCKSGSSFERRRFKRESPSSPLPRISLFGVQNSKEAWSKALGQTLEDRHVVCEKHFLKDMVVRHRVINSLGKNRQVMKLHRPHVTENAIPSPYVVNDLNYEETDKQLMKFMMLMEEDSENTIEQSPEDTLQNNLLNQSDSDVHESTLSLNQPKKKSPMVPKSSSGEKPCTTTDSGKLEVIDLNCEKDADSDCEIIETTSELVDKPDYVDMRSLNALISEPNEELHPVVEKIVSKLSNDEEFEKECDTFYKANLDIDVEMVQVDVTKALSEPVKDSVPCKRNNLSADVDDIRTSSDLPQICALCEDTEDHVQLLSNHFKNNHHLKEGQYVCPFCDYTSSKYEVVMKHTTKVHKLVGDKHTCDQCDFQTFRGDLFNRHSSQHLNENIYSCHKCNYKTIHLTNYKKHMDSRHPSDIKYKCKYCKYYAASHVAIKKHEETKHVNQKVLSCNKCPFTTMRTYNFERHLERYCKNRQQEPELFSFACNECTYRAQNENELRDHNLMHHPQKEVLFCKVCDFSTTEQSELDEHARIHMKKEPADNDD